MTKTFLLTRNTLPDLIIMEHIFSELSSITLHKLSSIFNVLYLPIAFSSFSIPVLCNYISEMDNHDLNFHPEMSTDNENNSSMNSTSAMESHVEIVRQQRFEIGPRYTDLKFIGEGAYGK